MFPQDPDVGFIPGLDGVDGAFVLKVEGMAVERSGRRIVQDRLIRDLDVEDGLQDLSGFPGGNGERDVKGQDKAEDVLGVVYFCKLDDRLLRAGVHKFLGFVMVLPVLIAEFKLRASLLLQRTFSRVELRKRLDTMPAAVVAALIERDLFPDFPAEERVIAVGAEVF